MAYAIKFIILFQHFFPDRQVYDHSPDIMVLRDKMLTCLDYLCRRNQPDGKRMFPRVFATVRDLYSASNEFNHIFFK